jgi:transposase
MIGPPPPIRCEAFWPKKASSFRRAWRPFGLTLVALVDDASQEGLTPLLRILATRFLEQLAVLETWIGDVSAQLRQTFAAEATCQRLDGVMGVGPVVATAVVGAVGDARAFKNGRQFAAWVGLTPRQHSSGERTRLLGITKRGDPYLRTLLVQGARAVLRTVAKRNDPVGRWLRQLLLRRHKHVVAIALANKIARIIWAVLAKEVTFQPALSAAHV